MFVRKNRNHVEIFSDRHRTAKLASWRIKGRTIPPELQARFTIQELEHIRNRLVHFACTGHPEVTRSDPRRTPSADFAARADYWCCSLRWGHADAGEIADILVATTRLMNSLDVCGLLQSKSATRPRRVDGQKT